MSIDKTNVKEEKPKQDPIKIGWFSSGEMGSEEGRRAARELFKTVMRAKQEGVLNIEISFVFSNIEPQEKPFGDEFFRLVKSYDLPLVALSSEKFAPKMRKKGKEESKRLHSNLIHDQPPRILDQWRDLYDEVALSPGYLGDFKRPDLCVLAGDMLIWGRPRCDYFNAINLHPAEPGGPKGSWQSVIWEVIKEKKERHGVMMHLVTPKLDEGPTVTFCRFPVIGGEFDIYRTRLEEDKRTKPLEQIIKEEYETNSLHRLIRKEGFVREAPLLIETIKLFADRQIEFRGKELYDSGSDTKFNNGYDLTNAINAGLARSA